MPSNFKHKKITDAARIFTTKRKVSLSNQSGLQKKNPIKKIVLRKKKTETDSKVRVPTFERGIVQPENTLLNS